VGPNTTLTGVGSALGFQRRGVVDRDKGSVIVASFDDPKKWMLSSAVYFREGELEGQTVPWRGIVTGRTYDQVVHSRCNAIQVRDLLFLGQENADGEPPWGGIRLQASPGAVLEGVGVFGVDVAYMLNAGWGLAMRDCTSGSYLYGLLALYDMNGLLLENCYINMQRSERAIDDRNVAPGSLSDRSSGGRMPEDYPYRKTGILTHYGHNITLNNVITEHWEIARFHVHGQISDTGSWLEGNSELAYALVTADLDLRNPRIYQPGMIGEGRFLRAGTNVRATISSGGPFPITWGNPVANRISVLVPDPDRAGWKHYPHVVSYANRRPGHIRVGGDDVEEIDNSRIADTTARVDLATALERIQASDHREWAISMAPGAVCSIPRPVLLSDRTVRFVGEDGGDRPTIRVAAPEGDEGLPLTFAGRSKCSFTGLDIDVRGGDGAAFAVDGGRLDLEMTGCEVTMTPDAASSLLTSRESTIIDATFSDVRIIGGQAVFVEGAGAASVVTCRAVNTIAPQRMLDRGVNGWVGEATTVIHSNIQAGRD
jgi:hypothetical protein